MPLPAAPPASPMRSLTIDHIGAQGDGRAMVDGRWVSVPFTLPGETVRVSGEGDRLTLVAVETGSPERAAPACRHFGRCGGCSLQHVQPASYAAFKRDLIVRALKARGLEADVAETWVTPPGSRRRAALAARKAGKGVTLGFHGRKSHELIAVEECPVMRPAMAAALPGLREIAALLLTGKEELTLLVTETASGLDLHVTRLAKETGRRARLRFGPDSRGCRSKARMC